MIETIYQLNTPLSLALLTDTHNCDPSQIIRSLERHRPDIICIAGDFVYGTKPIGDGLKMAESENAMQLFRSCAELAPTFVSLGNHEHMLADADLEMIEDTGSVVLDNTWVKHGDTVIGGLSSAYVRQYRAYRNGLQGKEVYPTEDGVLEPTEPEIDWLGRFMKEPGFHILLCHHPEYYPKYLSGMDIDLSLSGHAHGGQWRFFGRGMYAPGQGFFPKLTSGVHGGRMVISRGLANTTFVPRINNSTEIVYIQSMPRRVSRL